MAPRSAPASVRRAAQCRCAPVNSDLRRSVVALSEFEALRCEKLVAAFVERRRPPPHLRHQVDLGFSVRGQSVEIFEVRARWDDATQTTHKFVAKATFERNSGQWKVYWQRADMKWHSYAPQPRVDTLEEFLALLENDVHACFFG